MALEARGAEMRDGALLLLRLLRFDARVGLCTWPIASVRLLLTRLAALRQKMVPYDTPAALQEEACAARLHSGRRPPARPPAMCRARVCEPAARVPSGGLACVQHIACSVSPSSCPRCRPPTRPAIRLASTLQSTPLALRALILDSSSGPRRARAGARGLGRALRVLLHEAMAHHAPRAARAAPAVDDRPPRHARCHAAAGPQRTRALAPLRLPLTTVPTLRCPPPPCPPCFPVSLLSVSSPSPSDSLRLVPPPAPPGRAHASPNPDP